MPSILLQLKLQFISHFVIQSKRFGLNNFLDEATSMRVLQAEVARQGAAVQEQCEARAAMWERTAEAVADALRVRECLQRKADAAARAYGKSQAKVLQLSRLLL